MLIFTARKQDSVLALSVTSFVCESNISRTAEQICTKFSRYTHTSLRRVWMSWSKVKLTRDKNALCAPINPLAVTERNVLTANNVSQQQTGVTGPFPRCWGWV